MVALLLLLLSQTVQPVTTCLDAVGISGPHMNGDFIKDKYRLTEFTTVLCVIRDSRGKLTFSIALPPRGGTKRVIESPDLSELGEESNEFVELGTPVSQDGVRWKLRNRRKTPQTTACRVDELGKEAVCAFVGGYPEPMASTTGKGLDPGAQAKVLPSRRP